MVFKILRLVGVIGIHLAILSLMLEYACDIVVVIVLKACNYLCVLFLSVCMLAVIGIFLIWLDTLGLVFWPIVE